MENAAVFVDVVVLLAARLVAGGTADVGSAEDVDCAEISVCGADGDAGLDVEEEVFVDG